MVTAGALRHVLAPRGPFASKSGQPEAKEPYRRYPSIAALRPGLPVTKVSLRLSQCDCTESFTTASR